MRCVLQRFISVAIVASVLLGHFRTASADEVREQLDAIRKGYLANRTGFTHGTCRFRFAYWSANSEADALRIRPNNREPRVSLIYKLLFRDDIFVVAPDYDSAIVQRKLQQPEAKPSRWSFAKIGKFELTENGLINKYTETGNHLTLRAHPFALATDADINPVISIDYAERRNFEGIEFSIEHVERDGHKYLLFKTRSEQNSHDKDDYIDPERGYLSFITELTARKTGNFFSRMFLLEVHEEHGHFFPLHSINIEPVKPQEGEPFVLVREMEVLELDLDHVPSDEELVVPMHRKVHYWDGKLSSGKTLFLQSKTEYVKVPAHDIEKIYNELQLLALERLKGEKIRFLKFVTSQLATGEFATENILHLNAILALTGEDVQNWWLELTAQQREQLAFELKPFLDLSRAFAKAEKYRNYVLAHFAEIQHPTLKLAWAGLLFEQEQSSPEVIAFLKTALESEQNVKFLTELSGSDWSQKQDKLP